MNSDYIRQRITQLRIQKGVSEYMMSLDLGRSKGYIQGISSGRALPSMPEFLSICEYFGISPKDFFDEKLSNPEDLAKLNALASMPNKKDLDVLNMTAERLCELNSVLPDKTDLQD